MSEPIADAERGLGKLRLVHLGFRNHDRVPVLHTATQHERWGCEGCAPVYEYRTLYGDERYDRHYNANDPEAFARCKASGGCGGEMYSCSGLCVGITADDG